jgi:DNA gyrase subunit A
MAEDKIILVNIEDEMKSAYIDYSMSVIVSRALPDVRDGLKPVHRRVLYGMQDLGVFSNRPYKKSARIVGEVLGKYHPHGDSSVYDTMVRMAQPWSLRYPLVDGQGNYGSVDGDPPAAMRYTEARMTKMAEEMLSDIEKDTVDFRPNFDDSLQEPTVLPSRIPNLLVNGSSGIAVGMATNMPPHNLTEIINATIAYIDNREIDISGLMQYVKAPDFPTAGIIYGYEGVKDAFETGRGRIVMRAKYDIEEHKGRERIIVSEIPYLVNKAKLIGDTANYISDKKIEGISDIRDESDRDGMRIVYELKKDAIAKVVVNNLFKHTELQSSFSVNNVALISGRPQLLNIKQLISSFVEFRHEVVVRRTKYELAEAEKRAHILEGYLIAIDHLDEVIRLIRASKTPDEAKTGLIEAFKFSEEQAKAILELRLRVLTGLERDKIRAEYDDLMKMIAFLKDVLGDEVLRYEIIKNELIEVKDKYGDERRTEVVYAADEMNMESLIPDEKVVITISHLGYIKRTNLVEYRTQGRGGVGSKGTATRDEDFLEHMFVASTHNYLMFFTEKGRCFWMRAYEIPEGVKTSKGRAIQNLIQIPADDKVKAFINVKTISDPEYINSHFVIMCTKHGTIKKTALEAYSRPRANGINAITIDEEAKDELIEVKLTDGKSEIMIALKSGNAIRFPEEKVRPMGRTAGGVRGIRLDEDVKNDEVVGMICVNHPEQTVLVVSEKGYGKRTTIDDYRITNRGGKGVRTVKITEKTGNLIAIRDVTDKDDLMIITNNGITIRMPVADLREMGRATQGVRLINLRDGDGIAAVAKVDVEAKDESAEATAIDKTTEKPIDQEPNQTDSSESSPNTNEE